MDKVFVMDRKYEKCNKSWPEVTGRLEEPQGIWWVQNGRL